MLVEFLPGCSHSDGALNYFSRGSPYTDCDQPVDLKVSVSRSYDSFLFLDLSLSSVLPNKDNVV